MRSRNGYLAIADYFEEKISKGELKVNDRLPSTMELAKSFQVAPLTVQRGLSHLARKGLVVRKPRRGTIVSGHRHLSKHLAVVMGADPFSLESPFHRLVLKELSAVSALSDITIRPFFNVDQRLTHEFLDDLERRFSSGEVNCLLPLCGFPEFDVWLSKHENIAYVPLPRYDIHQLAMDGALHLLKKGYRRIATLSQYPRGEENSEGALRERAGVEAAFAEIKLDPTGSLPIQCGQSETAAHDYLSKLIEREGTPDAVLVLHDVNCRGVLAALSERGLKLKKDVAVVSHVNKGAEIAAPVKLTRLEVDPARIARDVLERISAGALRPGENPVEKEYAAPLIEGDSS